MIDEGWLARLSETVAQRDMWIRRFNKLEVSITHHRRDTGDEFSTDADERLWKARDQIMREASKP